MGDKSMKRYAIVGLACLSLAACEVPVMVAAANNDAELSGLTTITFPAQMLLSVEGRPDTLFVGEMLGRISGAAEIDLATADGRSCVGAMAASGAGEMTCDGLSFPMTREAGERTSMSGTVYRSGEVSGVGYAAAFGWGRGANEAVLRATLEQQRSLSARETRAAN